MVPAMFVLLDGTMRIVTATLAPTTRDLKTESVYVLRQKMSMVLAICAPN